MARFLSREWLKALAEVLTDHPALADVSPGTKLRILQRVLGGPEGDLAYVVELTRGSATVTPMAEGEDDASPTGDFVSVTAAYDVAAAISQGTLAPAAAFGAGRLRLGGDMSLLLRNTELIGALADAAAELSPKTSY